jgi:hypothetical protein
VGLPTLPWANWLHHRLGRALGAGTALARRRTPYSRSS